MSRLRDFGFVNKIRLKVARNYETHRASQGKPPLRSEHLLS